MAEVNTAEADQAAALAADAGFATGFTGTPPTEVAKVVEEPKVEPAKPAPAAPAPKSEYIRVTRQEWDNSKAALGKIPTLESALAKLNGSIPKTDVLVQQIVEKVRAETPAGMAVQFTKEDLAEIAEDFPELAEKLERALTKGKVKGTGTDAERPAAAEPIDIDKAVESFLTRKAEKEAAAAREKEAKELDDAFPDWGKIVGQPIAMGTKEPVETEWRKWATTNDQAALTTDSHAELKASIARFMEATKAPAPPAKPDRAAARRAVMEDAVTPRTDGAAPPLVQPASVDDAFAGGFKKVKRA